MARDNDKKKKKKRLAAAKGDVIRPQAPKTPSQIKKESKSRPPIDITQNFGGKSVTEFGVRPPPVGGLAEANLAAGRGIVQAKTQEQIRAGPGFIPTGEQQFGKTLVTPPNILTEGGLSGISPEEFTRVQAQTPGLQSKLQQDIVNPPDLKPESGDLLGKGVGFGLKISPLAQLLNAFGNVTGNEKLTLEAISKTKLGKALGLTSTAATAAVGAAGAFFAVPAITSAIAGTSIGASVVGTTGSSTALTTSIVGLGAFFGAKKIFDIEGAEMDQYRQSLKKVVEDGERIEAAVRNGMPISQSLELLGVMEQEVSFAESRLKELGIFNAEYRISKEYLLDQMNARSAREALLRRVLAIQNIAATGTAAVNPEALLFDIAQFEK